MKLEVAIALKYLIPNRKRLTSAIVSLLSMGVISLVVWLSIVFVSVIHGLEQQWIRDLSILHAPIRVTPTEAYYDSYYYRVDRYAESSHYTTKTIGEKLLSPVTDPYDPESDFILPDIIAAEREAFDDEKDLVKLAQQGIIDALENQDAFFSEYEEGMLHLYMERAQVSKEFGTLSQFVSYRLDEIYHNRVLPFDQHDYSTEVLNTFNRSSEGWEQDFLRLQESYRGESVILPISYKDLGYRVGDHCDIGFFSAEKGGEDKRTLTVIGFYNPGLSPLGNKTIFIDMDLASLIRAESEGVGMKNGWQIFFSDINQIHATQEKIQAAFAGLQISSYWDVDSLYDYDFFKPILEQLQSDQVLFLFVSIIILIVACSNIVTMSILLVSNKRKEIGILKAMGVSSRSLKIIFGLCGATSGAVGMIIGTLLAVVTLKNLGWITKSLSYLQGREAFNTAFFGESLPQECHVPFVIALAIGTVCLAIISGIIPAKQIAKMSVSDILKSD